MRRFFHDCLTGLRGPPPHRTTRHLTVGFPASRTRLRRRRDHRPHPSRAARHPLPHRHRYTYLAEASVPGGDPDSIATVDHATATTRRFVGDTGNSGCEPLFAPASDTEGDGWLLTVEHCAAERRSRVLILPAARPDTGPVAPIGLRHHVPMTFHGTFVPRRRAPGNRPVLQRICPAASSGRVRETPPRVAAAWWHVAGRPHRRGRTCRSSFAEDHLQQFGSSTTRSASRASLRALW